MARPVCFRRGLATNLHALGVDDQATQEILCHSSVSLTMKLYAKSVSVSQVNAMDTLGEKPGTYNDLATNRSKLVQEVTEKNGAESGS